MINTDYVVRPALWARDRSDGLHKIKLKRLEEYAKFHKWVEELKSSRPHYNGYLAYYEYLLPKRQLTYSEGCPIFNFFKLVPNNKFITDFTLEGLSEGYQIRDDIEEIISNNVIKKWDDSHTKTSPHMGEDYILYLTQDLGNSTHVFWLREVIDYCIKHKQELVIKEHIIPPISPDYMKTLSYIHQVVDNNSNVRFINKEYETFSLLSSARAVWAVDSGIGLSAIISKTPYSYFVKDPDYGFHLAAHYASSIEDAIEYDFSYDNFLSKFSWYYDKMVIDVNVENHFYKLDQRLASFFVDNVSDADFFR